MKKIIKIDKKKFISRILALIGIVLLFVIFKNSLSKNQTEVYNNKIILDCVDITETIENKVYINKNRILYLSINDIKNTFDKDLIIEDETGKIITTSGTKTVAIDTNNNTVEINSATILLENSILTFDDITYIPISEISKIYNVEVKCTENSAVIFSLHKALTTVSANKDIWIKEDTGLFSKNVQEIKSGQELVFIENAENNSWYKVLTYEGNIGFVKIKDVSDKNQVRINMDKSSFSDREIDKNNSIVITNKSIKDDDLQNFKIRKSKIDSIISNIVSKEKYTVIIDLSDMEFNSELFERFIIELIPRIKEIGAAFAITNNNDVISEEFISKYNIKSIEQ